MKRLIPYLPIFSLLITTPAFSQATSQVDVSAAVKKNSTKTNPLMIESTIQGSQVQPNVIYITPWQELDTPIEIDEKVLMITLPKFKPINPKDFKQQVKQYY